MNPALHAAWGKYSDSVKVSLELNIIKSNVARRFPIVSFIIMKNQIFLFDKIMLWLDVACTLSHLESRQRFNSNFRWLLIWSLSKTSKRKISIWWDDEFKQKCPSKTHSQQTRNGFTCCIFYCVYSQWREILTIQNAFVGFRYSILMMLDKMYGKEIWFSGLRKWTTWTVVNFTGHKKY